MVKKKSAGQEDTKQEDQFKQPENNTDSQKQEIIDESGEIKNSETGAEETTEESKVTETAPSDKVVPPEKSPEEKLAEMQDKYIRLSAEFDNYRKRTLREKIELTKYATENVLLNLLPVMDDFERALSHMNDSTNCNAIKEGIDLIYGKFIEFLKQNGITEIEAMNTVFNVDLHDAVAKTPVEDEAKKGKIVDVVQKGYYLLDKVIRHSKVVVGE